MGACACSAAPIRDILVGKIGFTQPHPNETKRAKVDEKGYGTAELELEGACICDCPLLTHTTVGCGASKNGGQPCPCKARLVRAQTAVRGSLSCCTCEGYEDIAKCQCDCHVVKEGKGCVGCRCDGGEYLYYGKKRKCLCQCHPWFQPLCSCVHDIQMHYHRGCCALGCDCKWVPGDLRGRSNTRGGIGGSPEIDVDAIEDKKAVALLKDIDTINEQIERDRRRRAAADGIQIVGRM